ncbi:MAG: hypothetical protein RLZZ342_618 [Candidatus Parcubacteria bacterium]
MVWASCATTALALAMFALYTPQQAAAVGTAADAMCIPTWDYGCPCGVVCKKGGPPGGQGCPCQDTTNQYTTPGKCVAAVKCLATGAPGQNGGMGDIKQALDAVKSILDMMKGGGGGGGGGGDQGSNPLTNPTLGGCAQYYNVTTPSSDPCAVYVPPVSNQLTGTSSSAAGDLISSLLTGGLNTGATTNTNTSSNTNTSTNTNTNTPATSVDTSGTTQTTQNTTATPVSVPQGSTASLTPGVSGDIQYSTNGVTVLVNNVDAKNGTQVAGFYGTAAGGQPTSVVSGMCQGRPWASNFLSSIIPSAFFDSLCQLRGYAIGAPAAPAPAVIKTAAPTATKPKVTTPVKPSTPAAPVATSSGPYVEPQADIWAVPSSVPLGARTTVFWNAKGVTSCTETSPDGSFSQSSLSGGAATVPLSGPTTYTISCTTPAGGHITNYVTVQLGSN